MAKKTAVKSAKPKAAKPKVAKSKAAKPKAAKRTRWLDPKTDTPLLRKYAAEMQSFLKAIADDVVVESEIKEQEKEVSALMKEIEPKLDDAMHEKVTRLLCEVTVYDMMQAMYLLQDSRPLAKFKG